MTHRTPPPGDVGAARLDVVLAIPTYCCEAQVGRVLDGLDDALAARLREVWVIDNGSSDGTVEAALQRVREGRLHHLRVFRTRENNSLGGTHKVAFQRAAREGATHVAILHGDDQAVGAELALLLDAAALHPDAQTVLGARFTAGSRLEGYDRRRTAGNLVLNALYSLVTRRLLVDLGSGLNLFALRDLDERTYLRFADGLTFNFDLVLDLVARGVRFTYLPITWREVDQVSNARNWRVFRTGVTNLVRWRLGRPAPARLAPRRGAVYEVDEVTA